MAAVSVIPRTSRPISAAQAGTSISMRCSPKALRALSRSEVNDVGKQKETCVGTWERLKRRSRCRNAGSNASASTR